MFVETEAERMSLSDAGRVKRKKVGMGSAKAHHGEILQGFFEGGDGQMHRGLVTLPCSAFFSRATFSPLPNSDQLTVVPTWKTKAGRAARLASQHLGAFSYGGVLEIESNIPAGWGLGSSTSDVVATIFAVADCLQRPIRRDEVARLSVRAETASDPIMFGDEAILFAHRGGYVIERLGCSLPSLNIVGFNTDTQSKGVNTLELPPAQYEWRDIESFRPLLGLLRRALFTSDARLVGEVASASARLNDKYLPKRDLIAIENISRAVGGLGVQIAHSGTVAGVLLDGRDPRTKRHAEEAARRITALGFKLTRHFHVGEASLP